jgi:hypothetical protein
MRTSSGALQALKLSPPAFCSESTHGHAADAARHGLDASTLCVVAVKDASRKAASDHADVGCVGPAQALPSIVQASPKLLRPLAAAERRRHRRSVNGHGSSVTVDSGGARA